MLALFSKGENMILDISNYNGVIDWQRVTNKNQIDRVILRGTTKRGELDTMCKRNHDALRALRIPVDIYKFSYATDCESGFNECINLISKLRNAGINEYIEIWLDIENDGATRWTKKRAYDVICGYLAALDMMDVTIDFGIYCNLDYFKTVIPDIFKLNIDLWIARWTNGALGLANTSRNIKLWQYTNKGKVEGITGDVDISREV